MNEERILRLADHMETVNKRKYKQDVWYDGTPSSRNATFSDFTADADYLVISPKEGFCGSSACVLGHAALVPDMGVFLVAYRDGVESKNGRRTVVTEPDIVGVDDNGRMILDEFSAAAHAFGITRAHAMVLFGPTIDRSVAHFYTGFTASAATEDWVSPARVAEVLRNYVATGGKSADDSIAAAA